MHAFTCQVVAGRTTFFRGLPSTTRLACAFRHTLFGENAILGPFLIPSTLEMPVLVFQGLHLADHPRIHPAILRTPFVERRVAPLSNIVSQYSAGPCIPCSRHSSETGTPPSAWRRIARIWGSLYLVIFIKISSDILPRKSYFRIPLGSGLITRISRLQRVRLPRGRRLVICHSVLRPASSP